MGFLRMLGGCRGNFGGTSAGNWRSDTGYECDLSDVDRGIVWEPPGSFDGNSDKWDVGMDPGFNAPCL